MRNYLTVMLVAMLAWWGDGTPVAAQEDAGAPLYRFDPALNVAAPPAPALTTDAPVVVDRDDDKTSLRLQTATPLAPYVGAERGPQLSSEEQRLLAETGAPGGLGDYRLEAGIGLFVEDKASLNLGYRFHEPPSLLNERRNDPLSLSGDLRIGFDVKVPF